MHQYYHVLTLFSPMNLPFIKHFLIKLIDFSTKILILSANKDESSLYKEFNRVMERLYFEVVTKSSPFHDASD